MPLSPKTYDQLPKGVAIEGTDLVAIFKNAKGLKSVTVEELKNNFIGELISLTNPLTFNNAGLHNSIYRGKNLGSVVTPQQYEACRKGTFDDLWLGDYWTKNGTIYFITGFNFWYNTGDTACTTNHINVMPLVKMYDQRMNPTNTPEGGYMGSEMYTSGLDPAKATINKDFGAEHILSHRVYLTNAMSNGKASGGAWADSTVELPTEEMMYGGNIFTAHPDGTNIPSEYKIGKSQLPVFKARPDLISNRQWFWLQNIVSSAYFARVDNDGDCYYSSASRAIGVRPEFAIH